MDEEMNRIVLCKYCRKPEYYGEMRWMRGLCLCRDCYKRNYEGRYGEYVWDDLDGRRPTMEEYQKQEEQNESKAAEL